MLVANIDDRSMLILRKLLRINIFLQPFVSTESINHLPYCIQVKIILSVSLLTDIEHR